MQMCSMKNVKIFSCHLKPLKLRVFQTVLIFMPIWVKWKIKVLKFLENILNKLIKIYLFQQEVTLPLPEILSLKTVNIMRILGKITRGFVMVWLWDIKLCTYFLKKSWITCLNIMSSSRWIRHSFAQVIFVMKTWMMMVRLLKLTELGLVIRQCQS